MSTASAAPAKEPLPLTPAQQQSVDGLSTMASLLTVVLLVAVAVQLVGGVYSYFTTDIGFVGALLTFVQGKLLVLLGLVMMACASDFKYLSSQAKFRGNHLRNAANNLAMHCNLLTGLGAVLAVVIVFRWVMIVE